MIADFVDDISAGGKSVFFAFGLSAKLMPKALELLFSPPHPPNPTPFVDFFF
jgi:hypothetical protein